MTSVGFYLNQNKCTGCKTCQIACKDLHNHPVGINFRRVYEYGGGTWKQENKTWTQDVFAYYTSIACNHCEDPACTKVCPTGAMQKHEDGYVIIDQEKCIGCKNCAVACPYGAPQFNEATKRMNKCDGCRDRVKQGMKPACVEACTGRALDFGNMDEMRAKYKGTADIAPLPNPSLTKPNLIINPGRTARPSDDTEGKLLNPKEV